MNLADVTVQITTLGIIVKVSALSTCGNLIRLPMILCTVGVCLVFESDN